VFFDDNFKDYKCQECTDLLKMARACGLPAYKGEKLEPVFKINFGQKIIRECPNSYCKWDYVGDSLEAWKYYKDGFLPEVYDEGTNRPLSILDQSEFFTVAHSIVESVKNKAEAKQYENVKGK
jgi:hypothetical protein